MSSLLTEETVFLRSPVYTGEVIGGGDIGFLSFVVVALESQEKGLLNFRAVAGGGAGEVCLSGAVGVGGVPLENNDAVETVDVVTLCCVAGMVLVED
jgi:hypothetical protein